MVKDALNFALSGQITWMSMQVPDLHDHLSCLESILFLDIFLFLSLLFLTLLASINKWVDLLEGTFGNRKFWTIVIKNYFKINTEAPKGPRSSTEPLCALIGSWIILQSIIMFDMSSKNFNLIKLSCLIV
jgi:hypothetical protein